MTIFAIDVTAPVSELMVGGSVQLTAIPRDDAGRALTARSVTWHSDNPNVIDVNATGVATALDEGSARIVASSEGREGSVSLVALGRHRLTIVAAGSGSGTVTGTFIDCRISGNQTSGTCSAEFNEGTRVDLTATADAGHELESWMGPCTSTTAICSVTMNSDRTVSVAFRPSDHSVTVTGAGDGSGRITGAGIDCAIAAGATSGDCNEIVTHNASLQLHATATGNSTFGGWGGLCAGASETCAIVVGADVAVQATFDVTPSQQVRVIGTGTGDGVVRGGPFDCRVTGSTASGACVADVAVGSRLTLEATPDAGHSFDAWAGECEGSSTVTCGFTVTAAVTIGAAFGRPQPPQLSSIRIARITLNSAACNPTVPTLVEHEFDFFDSDGDVPASVTATYSWVFHPNTARAGSFDVLAQRTGTGAAGSITSGICIAWGGDGSITSGFSILDAAGNRSNTIEINIPKPPGALSTPSWEIPIVSSGGPQRSQVRR